MRERLVYCKDLLRGTTDSSFFDSERAARVLTELYYHHPPTIDHSLNVAHIATMTSILLGGTNSKVCELGAGSSLHDIGKVGVPRYLLNSRNGLTKDQRDLIEPHAEIGAEIAQGFCKNPFIIDLIKKHHEDPEDPMSPRAILRVADYLDALTNPNRPYRKKLSIQEVEKILTEKFGPTLTIAAIKGARLVGLIN